MFKKALAIKEVGDLCGVELATVISWIKRGRLKAYETKDGRRIKLRDLSKFMEEYIPPDMEEYAEAENFEEETEDTDIITYIRSLNSGQGIATEEMNG